MKTLSMCRAARKRAISLIEAVLYLVVALAVIIGGIVFFQQAQENARIDRVTRGFASMIPNALAMSNKQNLSDISGFRLHEALYKAGYISEGTGIVYNEDTRNLETPWGSTLTIHADDGTAGVGDAPRLRIGTWLPYSACVRMSENIFTIAEASGLEVGTTVFLSGRTSRNATGRLTPAQLAENCYKGADTSLLFHLNV